MARHRSRSRGISQIETLLGVALGLTVLALATQTWGWQRQWLMERDVRQELFDRTPTLHRLLMRLSRQAGARPVRLQAGGWQLDPAYVAMPTGTLTWVHARAIQTQPALDPNCQNTRVWAKDAANAPAMIKDQFGWVDGQLKCKDIAQANARWQTWVEQVRGMKAWLAWQSGSGTDATWRWVAVDDPTPLPASAHVIGARLCLSMEASSPQLRRPAPPPDCDDRPLMDAGRVWRIWTRVWALRVDAP